MATDLRLERARRRWLGKSVAPGPYLLPHLNWPRRVVQVAVRGGEVWLGLSGDRWPQCGWLAACFRVVNPNAEAV